MDNKSNSVIILNSIVNLLVNFKHIILLQRLHHPLSIVMCHLLTKFILAASLRILWESWTKSKRPTLPWKPYVSQIGPAGIASALDIGLSNWSFEFITVSLYFFSHTFYILQNDLTFIILF